MRPHSFKIPAKHLLPFLAATLFVIQLGLVLGDLPSIRLMQDIICKHHYNVDSAEMLPEEDCRIEPVQQELNIICMGILVSVTVASALVAFPLGSLADRIGRLLVLGMGLLSMLLSQSYAMVVCWQWEKIPMRAIWGLGVPLVFGGGRSVAEAMVFTIISDVVSDSKRAMWFQWVVGAVLSAQLVAPILSGVLLRLSIWLPLFVSLGTVFVGGLILVLFAPETLSKQKSKHAFQRFDTDEIPRRKALRLLFARPAVLLLPGAALVIPLATIQSDILFRLMPIQFGWPLDQSALLISLRSLTTLVTLFIILPGITYSYYKMSNGSVPPFRRDSMLARASTLLFMLGSLFLMMVNDEILVITGLIVSSLGSGLPTVCRAMLVTLMEEEGIGSAFGMLAVGEILGFLAFELGMGSLFGVGLKSWIGLPFCLGTVLSLAIGTSTWLVRLPESKLVHDGLAT